MSNQYDDGISYNDENGRFDPNRLPESVKEEIRATTGAIAAVVGATGDNGAALNAQIAGVIGQNAVENNRFRVTSTTPDEVKKGTETASQNEFDLLGTLFPAHAALLSKDQHTKELNEFRAGLRRISGTGAITAGYGPYIIIGGKAYLAAAGESVAVGAGTSLLAGDNYMLSDLVYDASLGIVFGKVMDKGTGSMMKWADSDSNLFKASLNAKAKIIDYGVGSAGSGTLAKYLKENDIIIIEVPNFMKKGNKK